MTGRLARALSPTFADVWSQPRLFYNSLNAAEQQNLINAIRFELAQISSTEVKQATLTQLNRVSHDIALRVASAIGMTANVPAADDKYYHDNTTSYVSTYKTELLKLEGLKVGILTTTASASNYTALEQSLAVNGITLHVVAESLNESINQVYSATGAEQFDALIVDSSAQLLFGSTNATTTLYPVDRPRNILADAFRWGKPVAAVGSSTVAFTAAGVKAGPGVFTAVEADATLADTIKKALYTYTFFDRFALDKPLNKQY